MQPALRLRKSLVPLWIFLGCLAVYSINGRAIAEVDCDVAPYAAWSLVRHASFDVGAYPEMRRLEGGAAVLTADGALVSKYPPGSTLAALPFVAPIAFAREEPLSTRSRMRRLGKFIASVYTAGAVVFVFLICRRLAPSGAVPAALMAAFGTSLWSTASQGYWAHGPAAFFVALSFWSVIRNREGPSASAILAAGLGFGMAFLIRPSTALFAAATIFALVMGRRWRESALLSVAVSAVGALLVLYNHHFFGNLIAGGYLDEVRAWSTPLRVGLPGLLIAPSRGLLVYSPALILVAFCIQPLRASDGMSNLQRRMVAGWLAAGLATVVTYSGWHIWWGGWSFGPRFLIEAIPAFAIGLALGWQWLDARWGPGGRRIAWLLVAVSVSIHFVGIFGYHVDWMATHGPDELFSWTDTQIGARAAYLIDHRPIALLLPAFVAVTVAVRQFRIHARAERRRESQDKGPALSDRPS